MSNYKTARTIASVVSVFGWIFAVTALFFTVFRLIQTDVASYPASLPFIVLVASGLALVLLGWIARAVFDIADRS